MVARSLGHEVRGQHGYLSLFSYKSSWNTFFPCKKYSWNTEHIWTGKSMWESLLMFLFRKKSDSENPRLNIFSILFFQILHMSDASTAELTLKAPQNISQEMRKTGFQPFFGFFLLNHGFRSQVTVIYRIYSSFLF